jgi:hypothetical protein
MRFIRSRPFEILLLALLAIELYLIFVVPAPVPAPTQLRSLDPVAMNQLHARWQQTHPGQSDPIPHAIAFEHMTVEQQQLVGYFIADGSPLAQSMIARVSPDLQIVLSDDTSCGAYQYCTSHSPLPATSLPLSGRRWIIQLPALHFAADPVTRFVFWHELGHVIDQALIDDQHMQALMSMMRTSPAWQECWPRPALTPGQRVNGADKRGCLSEREIFAEQFAIWALTAPQSSSGYALPRLVGDHDEFAQALVAATSG